MNLTNFLMEKFPVAGGQSRWFVEAGAYTGLPYPSGGSTTWDLEQAGWLGICVEPSTYGRSLPENRKCLVDRRALGPECGIARFRQVFGNYVELSGLVDYFQDDKWSDMRSLVKSETNVDVVTLSVLLRDHHAPPALDFLSLDTEGSELAILQSHDFKEFAISCIFVEYNGIKARRRALWQLLESWGYKLIDDDGQNLLLLYGGMPWWRDIRK